VTNLKEIFNSLIPATEFCSLRTVHKKTEVLSVRRDIVQPPNRSIDAGAMVMIAEGDSMGYAATSELTTAGLSRAIRQARDWAKTGHRYSLPGSQIPTRNACVGNYSVPVEQPWTALPVAEKIDLLRQQCARLKIDERIQNWQTALCYETLETTYLNCDGAHIQQQIYSLAPMMSVTAHHQGESQRRTFGGDAFLRQGGLEVLEQTGFYQAAPQIAEQALLLLAASNCPADTRDLLLAPDQMALQIHESIGHPLELDRILGDERNYAGTSFVTPDMFGSYRYGSELLNVIFDPTVDGEIASYAYDDDGHPAQREYLIKNGILLRPLGGALSQHRANLPGVANSRASSWNRPSIDRMANINIEAGTDSFAAMVERIERGIYMETNRSWSIDDSRNKFQFGCEWAQLIENGELTRAVKNPNYRGISAQFWRSLSGVGNAAEVQTMGTAYCGKGEPNQSITVGHAAPPCLFNKVAVFGGE
jgi:predicted Zn-dependent protease